MRLSVSTYVRLQRRSRPNNASIARLGSYLAFEVGRGTGVCKENVGSVVLGSATAWPCYWSPYIVAGYRYVSATMENDCKEKELILKELVIIQSVVVKNCLPDRTVHASFLHDLLVAFAWKPPSAEFLTSRLPTLKAAHLTILVDFHKKFFGPHHPTPAKYTYTNAFLRRMFKMINVLDPYLACEKEDLRGTPFENAEYALADERFDCLKDYCEMATKDKKVTAKICF